MKYRALLIGVVLVVVLVLASERAQSPGPRESSSPLVSASAAPAPKAPLSAPIERFRERVTKKPFGIFITRENSPVTPEVFYGYHTAADFEIFPGEENKELYATAICSGKILQYRTGVTGYGGVVVQQCAINNQAVTVVYGHIVRAGASIGTGLSDAPKAGETIGILGKAYSAETGNERKHLHVGIRKGTSVDIRGYVQNQSELSGWIDPMTVLPN